MARGPALVVSIERRFSMHDISLHLECPRERLDLYAVVQTTFRVSHNELPRVGRRSLPCTYLGTKFVSGNEVTMRCYSQAHADSSIRSFPLIRIGT